MRYEEVELFVGDDGAVIAVGDRDAITVLADQIARCVGGAAAVPAGLPIGDGLGALGAALGFAGTYGEYFAFAPETLKKVKDGLRLQQSASGLVRGFLKDAAGAFGGDVQMRPVSLVAEHALSVQLTMATIALRAAIKNVEQAVERVEHKVDRIALLLDSQRLGDVIGVHTILRDVWERSQRGDTAGVTNTDWDVVAGLGPQIMSQIVSLRAFARRSTAPGHASRTTAARAEQAERIAADDGVGDTLALLAIAQTSLRMWHQLCVARVATTDAGRVQSALCDAATRLRTELDADQELLRDLRGTVESLTRATALEGFNLFSPAKLASARERLEQELQAFARHRGLLYDRLDAVARPGLRESTAEVGTRAVEAGKTVGSAAADVARQTKDTVATLRDRFTRPSHRALDAVKDAACAELPVAHTRAGEETSWD